MEFVKYMSASENISIGLDTEKLDQDIDETNRKTAQLAQRITSLVRRGFDTVVILGEVTGQAISQSSQLLAQAAFIAAETVLQIAAAGTITVVGAINAGIGLTVAAGLFAQSAKISQTGEQASVEIQGIIALANTWRF